MTALFAALLDDAALFPPGDAPMPAAVRAHRELRRDLARYTGPFVVPAAATLHASMAGGGWVVTSQAAWKGWHVVENGRELRVRHADEAFAIYRRVRSGSRSTSASRSPSM